MHFIEILHLLLSGEGTVSRGQRLEPVLSVVLYVGSRDWARVTGLVWKVPLFTKLGGQPVSWNFNTARSEAWMSDCIGFSDLEVFAELICTNTSQYKCVELMEIRALGLGESVTKHSRINQKFRETYEPVVICEQKLWHILDFCRQRVQWVVC